MGTYLKAHKTKAIKLRLQGKSYGEIKRTLGLRSKGTLSVWFKNLHLTPTAKKRLEKHTARAVGKGLFDFNKNRTERIKKENTAAREMGLKEIGGLNKRDLLLLGASLYWGEGTKAEATVSYTPLTFTNSDPRMIQMFLRFAREILKVPDEKIHGGVHLYEGMSVEATKEFWAQCTNLPSERFYTVCQVSRASKRKRRTLPFGTMAIKIFDRLLFNRVKGMIQGLSN